MTMMMLRIHHAFPNVLFVVNKSGVLMECPEAIDTYWNTTGTATKDFETDVHCSVCCPSMESTLCSLHVECLWIDWIMWQGPVKSST